MRYVCTVPVAIPTCRARVSTTNGQTPSNQIGRLREVAEKAGWEIVEEFVDRGISGAKGRGKLVPQDLADEPASLTAVPHPVSWTQVCHAAGLTDLAAFHVSLA